MTSKRQCKAFSRRCESIGFQKFVVTYWPSSWLRPRSLRGEVSWNWASNASRTLRSKYSYLPLLRWMIYLTRILFFCNSWRGLRCLTIQINYLVPSQKSCNSNKFLKPSKIRTTWVQLYFQIRGNLMTPLFSMLFVCTVNGVNKQLKTKVDWSFYTVKLLSSRIKRLPNM